MAIKTKVLLITDSLGLPRIEPEKVIDEQAWPNLLTKERDDCDFYHFSRSGLDSRTLVEELKGTLGAYQPDVIVLQVGIVDCTPRVLRLSELSIIRRIPIISGLVQRIVTKHRAKIIQLRKVQYVDLTSFKKNLIVFKTFFNDCRILALPIVSNTECAQIRTPNIAQEIVAYNDALSSLFEMINIGQLKENDFMSDCYHLSPSGNELVSLSVSEVL
ncbi:hypothetical protein ACP3V5_19370 [Vibrio maritimus]